MKNHSYKAKIISYISLKREKINEMEKIEIIGTNYTRIKLLEFKSTYKLDIRRWFIDRPSKYGIEFNFKLIHILNDLLANENSKNDEIEIRRKSYGIIIFKGNKSIFLEKETADLLKTILPALIEIINPKFNEYFKSSLILLSLLSLKGNWGNDLVEKIKIDKSILQNNISNNIIGLEEKYAIWCQKFGLKEEIYKQNFTNISRFDIFAWDQLINPSYLFKSFYYLINSVEKCIEKH